jgi:predicted ATPase
MATNIVITGAMGSGKSTALTLLKQKGFITVEEPARSILAEQHSIKDDGVPEKNPKLFTQLLLSRAIYQYKMMQANEGIVIYDRGIPDNIAYSEIFNLDYKPAHLASKLFRYDKNVFIFPAWEEIYATDDKRKMSFLQAKAFGDNVRKIYENYGYFIIDIPCASPEERTQFIIERIK